MFKLFHFERGKIGQKKNRAAIETNFWNVWCSWVTLAQRQWVNCCWKFDMKIGPSLAKAGWTLTRRRVTRWGVTRATCPRRLRVNVCPDNLFYYNMCG